LGRPWRSVGSNLSDLATTPEQQQIYVGNAIQAQAAFLVVPVCLWAINGGRRSSNYIEIGQSSNWLRTDRGTSLNVGVSTQGRSRCHGSSAAVARGTCNRCDQKTRRPGLAADCRLRPKP